MSIEDPKAFLASIWDWAPLKRCFPRGVSPTDIDGFVELGGYFLILEGKAPGVPLKGGQLETFQKMDRWNQVVPGLFTIIVIWGNAQTKRIDQLQFWPADPIRGGWDRLRTYVSAWAEIVEERAAIQNESATPLIRVATKEPAPVVPDPTKRMVTAEEIFGSPESRDRKAG